jgi:hypothetical protein
MIAMIAILFSFPLQASASMRPVFELKGKVVSDRNSKCATGKAQLFISNARDQTLVYQTDVIPNGSFQFKLIPATYQIRVITSSNCEGITILDATRGEKESKLEVNLQPKKRGKI